MCFSFVVNFVAVYLLILLFNGICSVLFANVCTSVKSPCTHALSLPWFLFLNVREHVRFQKHLKAVEYIRFIDNQSEGTSQIDKAREPKLI